MAGLPANDFDKRLGVRLSQLRIERKRTQREVAGALGVSAAQLQKYEKGVNCLSSSHLQKVARFLEVSPMLLLDPEAAHFAQPDAPPQRSALDLAHSLVDVLTAQSETQPFAAAAE